MKTVCEKNKCNGCMACVDRCPKRCININDKIEYINAVIDESKCINCKLCEKVCPNNSPVSKNDPIDWKQGWATTEIRKYSTSGGLAASIMENFINNGGYVASCLFRNGNFFFDLTNDLKKVKKFVGSKYVKSNPVGIYKKIEEQLKTSKVLFIGLPCQVAALKNYIVDKTNLYTIDLICHGTPSINVLKVYLQENGYRLDSLNDIKFRDKVDFGVYIDGKKVELSHVIDEYLCTFLAAINYTENCYSCSFTSTNRVSDITLGDSWGTEYHEEEKKGVSLILCQTEKGKDLLESLQVELKAVNINNAIKNNHQLYQPAKRTKNRDKFLNMIISGKSYKYSTFICLPKTTIKQKIKKILIRLHLCHIGV